MTKPKVLLVNGSAPSVRCGVGIYSRQLMSYLLQSCEVTQLTTKDPLGIDTGLSLCVTNWGVRSLPRMRAAAIQTKADVVHIQYPTVGYKRELGINLLPLVLRVSTRKKVVVTLHEYYGSALLGKIRNIVTTLFAHKVIVSNDYDRSALPFLIRRKTSIIRIGHTIQKQPANKRTFQAALKSADFTSTKPVITYFGFVNPSKGIDMLVQAMPNIPAQLMLLSELRPEDTYHKKVLSLINKARANGAHIWVSGYVEDRQLSEILQESGFFVLPQPLPLTAKSSTAIVAAEHGLVVVGTAAEKSHYNEPFSAKNSLLLEHISPQTIAEACTKLIANTHALQDLKKHNAELVQHFSWPHIAKQHHELYTGLM